MGEITPTPIDDTGGAPQKRTPNVNPVRRCLVLAESGPRDALIRFALSPDGLVTPDLAEKLPGRGCYVTADPALIRQAIDKKLFARAFKTACQIPPDLIETITKLLTLRLEAQLGLAKKAGLAILGEDAVSQAIRGKKARLVLLAADASPRTSADIRHNAGKYGLETVDLPLPAAAVGAALGRDNTVYLAIGAGKMATSLMRDCARLTPFVTKTSLKAGNDGR